MHDSYGFRARAHHLVGVAAAPMHLAVAPCVKGKRRMLLRMSRRSLVVVDAKPQSTAWHVNPRYIRLCLDAELQQRQPEQQQQVLRGPGSRRQQIHRQSHSISYCRPIWTAARLSATLPVHLLSSKPWSATCASCSKSFLPANTAQVHPSALSSPGQSTARSGLPNFVIGLFITVCTTR